MKANLEKLVPHNVEAEQAVLGSILIDPEAMHMVAPMLRAEDCFLQKHRWIYAAMLSLHQRGTALDMLTLTTELAHREQLEPVGGAGYVSQLINTVPSAINVGSYVQIVREAAMRRRALDFASQVAKLAHDRHCPLSEMLDHIESEAFGLRKDLPTDRLRRLEDVLDDVYADLKARASDDQVPMMPTGYAGLDKKLGGWRRGALYTIGAATGKGKTALLLNIGTHAAQRGRTVLIFSLEMTAKSLAERLITAEAGVSLVSLTSGHITEGDWPKITDAVTRIRPHPIWIDDTSSITIPMLRSQVRRFALHYPLDLVLVDYLQLARLGRPVSQRYLEVGLISQELKRLAREMNVPVIAAAQLSRAVDQRMDKRPQLSDLRESGNIEQDSDAVLLIHREEGGACVPATLIVGKNRNGPTGDVNLLWLAQKVSFISAKKEGAQ
jgi:replicative DNA helicase